VAEEWLGDSGRRLAASGLLAASRLLASGLHGTVSLGRGATAGGRGCLLQPV